MEISKLVKKSLAGVCGAVLISNAVNVVINDDDLTMSRAREDDNLDFSASMENEDIKYFARDINVLIAPTITGEKQIFLLNNVHTKPFIKGVKGTGTEIFTGSQYCFDTGESELYTLLDVLLLEEAKEAYNKEEISEIYSRIRRDYNNISVNSNFDDFAYSLNENERKFYADQVFFYKTTNQDEEEALGLVIVSPSLLSYDYHFDYRYPEDCGITAIYDVFTGTPLQRCNYVLQPIADLIPVEYLKQSYYESELKQILSYAQHIEYNKGQELA